MRDRNTQCSFALHLHAGGAGLLPLLLPFCAGLAPECRELQAPEAEFSLKRAYIKEHPDGTFSLMMTMVNSGTRAAVLLSGPWDTVSYDNIVIYRNGEVVQGFAMPPMGQPSLLPLEPSETEEGGVWFKGLGPGHFEMVGLASCKVMREDRSFVRISVPIPYLSFDIGSGSRPIEGTIVLQRSEKWCIPEGASCWSSAYGEWLTCMDHKDTLDSYCTSETSAGPYFGLEFPTSKWVWDFKKYDPDCCAPRWPNSCARELTLSTGDATCCAGIAPECGLPPSRRRMNECEP